MTVAALFDAFDNLIRCRDSHGAVAESEPNHPVKALAKGLVP
jgi:hypothetical protein